MSDAAQLWYNPSCSKSRKALALLRERGLQPEVLQYLESPPDREMIKHVVRLINGSVRDLMRKKEAPYLELGLDAPGLSDDALIDAMLAHPVLIQRPVLIQGDWAVIGRPPERVLRIFD